MRSFNETMASLFLITLRISCIDAQVFRVSQIYGLPYPNACFLPSLGSQKSKNGVKQLHSKTKVFSENIRFPKIHVKSSLVERTSVFETLKPGKRRERKALSLLLPGYNVSKTVVFSTRLLFTWIFGI